MTVNRQCVVLGAALLAASLSWIGGGRAEARRSQQPTQGGGAPVAGGQRGQASATTGTAFLAGQVVEQPGGAGVGGATVSVLGRGPVGRGGGPIAVIADSQGRFFFADLPAGSYTLIVSKMGYVTPAGGGSSRSIDLADGERVTGIKTPQQRLGSIAGTVRDDGGDPAVGSTMIMFRKTLVNGHPIWRQFKQGSTDDRGVYFVGFLIPGDYLVCSCGREACGSNPLPFDGVLLTTLAADPLQLMGVAGRALKVGADVADLTTSLRTSAPTFHPNALSVGRATPITLGSGEDRTGVDIEVTGARSTRVSGTIIGAIGPVRATSIRLVPAGDDPTAEVTGYSPMLVQPDGRFDFAGVPPGQYVLRVTHTPTDPKGVPAGPSGAALMFLGSSRASSVNQSTAGQLPDEPPQWAAEPLTVGDDGANGVTVMLKRASGISGRVVFIGAASQPTAQVLQRGVIIPQLVTADPASGVRVNNAGPITADSLFHVPGLVPGRYVLNATGFSGWPTMKSIVVAGIDMTDLPIDMESSDIADVVVTFSDVPMGTLGGTVSGAPGDVTVMVFPADRKYWADPAAGRRRFGSGAVNRNGTFTIGARPAGEYFVVVLPDQDSTDWQEIAKLDALSKRADRVTIADGDKKLIEIKR